MSKFTGRLEQVGIGKEGTRGTGVDPTYWMPKTAVTFDDKVVQALVRGSYGHITDAPMTAQVVSKWAEGDIEGEINISSFGLILLALCGTDTPALADTCYTHAYTINNDVAHTSLSIQAHDPIGDLRFRLAMLNSLSIEVALGEFVKFTSNFISKAHQDTGVFSPTYAIDQRFVSKDLTLKVADDISGITAATKLKVKNLTVEFNKNVEKIDVLGTPEPEDILLKGLNIKGTIELNYEDRTWRDYMLNGTAKALSINLKSSKLLGATTYPELSMIFPKVRFFDWEKSTGLDDIASQSVSFEVMYDLANTRLWSTLSLVNKVASY
jgi:hypothetical protein